MAFISHKGQMKITNFKGETFWYLCCNFEFLVLLGVLRAWNWILAFFGIYLLQRPNLNSLFHALPWEGLLSIWFCYYKWFLRTLPYYGFANKLKSTRKYLNDNLVYSSMCLIILLLLQLEYLGDAGIPSFKQIEFLTKLAFFP